ncbi:MAG: DNA polymerase-3 subunit delta, partial [Sphingobacteriales bacterium]
SIFSAAAISYNEQFNQQQPKLWPAKQQLIRDALTRLNITKLEKMLIQCAEIEISIKVENRDSNWLKLNEITYSFF